MNKLADEIRWSKEKETLGFRRGPYEYPYHETLLYLLSHHTLYMYIYIKYCHTLCIQRMLQATSTEVPTSPRPTPIPPPPPPPMALSLKPLNYSNFQWTNPVIYLCFPGCLCTSKTTKHDKGKKEMGLVIENSGPGNSNSGNHACLKFDQKPQWKK